MYAPGGFNAVVETWSTQSIYAKIKLLDHLPKSFTCILFDRRECGQSGGRVEPVTWSHYVAQGKGLLDHLQIERAHLIGGCMGCAPIAAFAVAYPQRVASLVFYWPVGGAKYRIASHQRFADHLKFVRSDGLAGVVGLVRKEGKTFGADPRGGPWASVIKRDDAFADAFAKQDNGQYVRICEAMRDALFDRDTAPGATPEDLMRTEIPSLIVPGHDASHATSAARYLEECLPRSDYWDVPVDAQTESATNARVLEFLRKAAA
jgi:pimeloyl-ACP methyl ester carboxylesterase